MVVYISFSLTIIVANKLLRLLEDILIMNSLTNLESKLAGNFEKI